MLIERVNPTLLGAGTVGGTYVETPATVSAVVAAGVPRWFVGEIGYALKTTVWGTV
jgi:hypothetical protein